MLCFVVCLFLWFFLAKIPKYVLKKKKKNQENNKKNPLPNRKYDGGVWCFHFHFCSVCFYFLKLCVFGLY